MVTSRFSQTNGLSGLTRHGPHFYKQFLERMYAMNGLDEDIVFILNKPRMKAELTREKWVGGRKRRTRKTKN